MAMQRWMRMAVAALLACGVVVSAAGAQDPLKTLPKNYWMEFQNPWVKVIHAHYPARQVLATHDHPGTAALYVYLNDAGGLRFVHMGDNEMPVERKPVKTGQLRIAAAKAETHRVESLSDTDSDSLRVEFQTIQFPVDMTDVRVPAADEAFWEMPSPEKVEFEDEHLRVTRIGVRPGVGLTLRMSTDAKKVLWIAVRAKGVTFARKAAHAGQCWDGSTLNAKAISQQAELLRVELK